MKKILALVALCICGSLCFSQSFTATRDGNAWILSYNDLKFLHEHKDGMTEFTANELVQWYERIRNSCGNNELLFDQKRETDFAIGQ